jgi:hypothetical protein
VSARWSRFTAAAAAGLALAVTAVPAAARERLAVFVLAEADPELSDNLTEVTIAKLAEARDYELVGRRELDVKLGEIPLVREEGLSACLAKAPCLAGVGARAGARRAVIGNVERREDVYVVRLSLVDTTSGHVSKSAHAEAPAELSRLIATLQSSAVDLMVEPSARPPAPESGEAPAVVPAAPALAPVHEAAGRSQPPRPSPPPAQGDRVSSGTPPATYAGFGAAGLAIVAFSTAAITGSIANGPPSGDTRKERQDDIARRQQFATVANVALAAGGVFSVTAVLCFALP